MRSLAVGASPMPAPWTASGQPCGLGKPNMYMHLFEILWNAFWMSLLRAHLNPLPSREDWKKPGSACARDGSDWLCFRWWNSAGEYQTWLISFPLKSSLISLWEVRRKQTRCQLDVCWCEQKHLLVEHLLFSVNVKMSGKVLMRVGVYFWFLQRSLQAKHCV